MSRAYGYRYWASCPDLNYRLASYLPDAATEITYRTFRKYVSRTELLKNPWGKDALWRISYPDNWSVSFGRTKTPSGVKLVYLSWGGYEIYFVDPSAPEIDIEDEASLADQITFLF